MSINAESLVKEAKLEIARTEEQIKKLQKKASLLAEKKAISITQLFLENNLNFPDEVIALSSSGALKSLIILFQQRLLKEEELTPAMIKFLVWKNVHENKFVQEKIKESFYSWSEEAKIKFSFASPHSQLYYHYLFINDYLRQYSVGQDDNFWKNKMPLYLSLYNSETCVCLLSVFLDFVDTLDKVKEAATQLNKIIKLGYNEKRIHLAHIEFVIEIDNDSVKLVETERFRPDSFTFSGSFEEQLEQAILKSLEIKKAEEELSEED